MTAENASETTRSEPQLDNGRLTTRPSETTSYLRVPIGDYILHEIHTALKKFMKNKAPGPDEVPIELLKQLDVDNLSLVLALINEIKNGEFPEHIKEGQSTAVAIHYLSGLQIRSTRQGEPAREQDSVYFLFESLVRKLRTR